MEQKQFESGAKQCHTTTINFTAKTVIVTGGSSGIGAALVKAFLKSGANVVFTGRNEENLKEVETFCLKEYNIGPEKLQWTCGDITDKIIRQQIIDQTLRCFKKIDILINNAGIALGSPLDKVVPHLPYETVMDVNLKSAVDLTILAIPYLKETRGNIVNISSIAATRPIKGLAHYCMSKAALDMFTKSLALELGPHKIRANAVRPGEFPTNIGRYLITEDPLKKTSSVEKYEEQGPDNPYNNTPLGRQGQLHEVVNDVLFLASNELSSYTTGAILDVDGGINIAGIDPD